MLNYENLLRNQFLYIYHILIGKIGAFEMSVAALQFVQVCKIKSIPWPLAWAV